jgi:hypothetical protein
MPEPYLVTIKSMRYVGERKLILLTQALRAFYEGNDMNRSKAIGTSVAAILLGGGALAIGGFALASATPHQAALQCVTTSPGNCSLTLSTWPDSLAGQQGLSGGAHPDWVAYSNFRLEAPANTVVHMTIKQYDSGGPLNNSFFSHVYGTTTGKATWTLPKADAANANPSSYEAPVTGSTWDTNSVGHTFTLRGIPQGSSPALFVSVPLPANPDTKSPVTSGSGTYGEPVLVNFSFKTGSAGTVYEWNCEFPCGGSREGQFGFAMSSYGYMSGALTVK